MAILVFISCKDEYKLKFVQWVIYVVSERKLAKLSFRAEREIFCLLKLLSLQISLLSVEMTKGCVFVQALRTILNVKRKLSFRRSGATEKS